MEFAEAQKEALGCTRCGLCHSRTQVVFGEGPLREMLTRQITARGLEDVFLLPGFRGDVAKYLPHLDVATLPSFTH